MTPTQEIIALSERASDIYACSIFEIIEPDNDGVMVNAFGVHFLLVGTNFILVYDRFGVPDFSWYISNTRVTKDVCLFGIMDYGLKEVSFEYVFDNIAPYQQEYLLYMMHMFMETE